MLARITIPFILRHGVISPRVARYRDAIANRFDHEVRQTVTEIPKGAQLSGVGQVVSFGKAGAGTEDAVF